MDVATGRWADLTSRQRRTAQLGLLLQLALTVLAWVDLRRRPASQIRGPKWLWAVLILINFVGPLGYFRLGRLRRQLVVVIDEHSA